MTEPRWNAKHLAAWDYLLLHPEGVEVPRMAAHLGWSRQATTDRLDALYVRDKATRDPSPIRGRPHVYHAVRSAAPPSPSIPRVRNRPSVSQRRPKAVPAEPYTPPVTVTDVRLPYPLVVSPAVAQQLARHPAFMPYTSSPGVLKAAEAAVAMGKEIARVEAPPFPLAAICECGCPGAEHRVVWKGDEFIGTRCAVEDHGGHKFAIARPRCELCPEPVEGAERFCPTHLAIYTRLTQ